MQVMRLPRTGPFKAGIFRLYAHQSGKKLDEAHNLQNILDID